MALTNPSLLANHLDTTVDDGKILESRTVAYTGDTSKSIDSYLTWLTSLSTSHKNKVIYMDNNGKLVGGANYSDITNLINNLSSMIDMSDYLPLSGGQLTGALTVPELNVTGSSTFTQIINGSINGNSGTTTKLANPVTITVGNQSFQFDGTQSLTFAGGGTGNVSTELLNSYYWANIHISASSSTTTTPTVGALTVNGTANITTVNGSLSGNASTASKLLNARTITVAGVSKTFDGSGNISFPLTAANITYNSETTKTALDALINKVFLLEWTTSGTGDVYIENGVSQGVSITVNPKKRGTGVAVDTLTWNTTGSTSTPTSSNPTNTSKTFSIATNTGNLTLKFTASDNTTTLTAQARTIHKPLKYLGYIERPAANATYTNGGSTLNVYASANVYNTAYIKYRLEQTHSGAQYSASSGTLAWILNSTSADVPYNTQINIPGTGTQQYDLIYAVYGSTEPVPYNTLGKITGCQTGTASVKRKNSSTTDTYKFVIVPGSTAPVTNIIFKAS